LTEKFVLSHPWTSWTYIKPQFIIPTIQETFSSRSQRKHSNTFKTEEVKIQQIISYKPYVHKWEPTVYFPYWNESGEQTFYIGRRFVDDDGPKTLEPKSSTKPLFGLHVKRPKPVVFLVEGVFDHLMTPDSYAILGSMITMDPDASDKCLNNAFRLNRSGLRAWPVMFGGDKDPGDLGLAQMSGVCNHLRNLRLSRMQDIYVDCKSFGG